MMDVPLISMMHRATLRMAGNARRARPLPACDIGPLRRVLAAIAITPVILQAQPVPASAPATTAPTTTPAGAPATAPADAALWREMTAIDRLASSITQLRADFEQRKFTPLLRKPIISSGHLLARHEKVLTTTLRPERSVMLVDASEIRLYYPDQKIVEIYPVDKDVASLASSPLPRLDVLRRFFSFQRLEASTLDPSADDKSHLALKLTPTDEALAEHVSEVRVLLDRASGLVKRVETIDPDGDRNIITFSNVQTADLTEEPVLNVPAGTKISRPLEGLSPPQSGG